VAKKDWRDAGRSWEASKSPTIGVKGTLSVSVMRAAPNCSEGDGSIYAPSHERHRHRNVQTGDLEKENDFRLL
jgi:hypothetical protein